VNTTPTITMAGSSQTICSGSAANISASGATTYTWNTGATTSTITVSPAATIVYSVTGFNGSCPSAPKSATITVLVSPTVSVNSVVICAGNSANLTASGASTYSWNTGATTPGILVSPSSTTVYTVTGTSNNCMNTKTSTVTVNPLPNIIITASNTVICVGQAVSLTASGASTFTWQPGNVTGATVNFTPSASQVYTCAGTSAAGCDGNNSVSISVSPCTGIMNGTGDVQFNVYPNPAKDKLTININTTRQFECYIEISDAAGKSVYAQKARFNTHSNEFVVNIGNFANGVYFIKINSKEGSVQPIKIVKE
jgi:hypothetical protein